MAFSLVLDYAAFLVKILLMYAVELMGLKLVNSFVYGVKPVIMLVLMIAGCAYFVGVLSAGAGERSGKADIYQFSCLWYLDKRSC